MIEVRNSAILDQVARNQRSINYPSDPESKKPRYVSEIFAENVFTLKTMQKHLPKPIFAKFVGQLEGNKSLDKPTADAIAHAVRVWAMDRGATHYTHLFQPQTDTTAEKHDSFLNIKTVGHEVSVCTFELIFLFNFYLPYYLYQ